jgi:hypothetical protein
MFYYFVEGYSPYIIMVISSRRMRWGGDISMHGESRNADKILFGKYEGKRPSGRIGIERSIGRVFYFIFYQGDEFIFILALVRTSNLACQGVMAEIPSIFRSV